MSSGDTISGQSGTLPVNGTRWPFIWGGNFSGGKLDTSGTPVPQFDDSALGGTGPTSALTQFARCTAAYLRGFQNAYQVSFYAISIQNELNFEQFYSSCRYALSSQYLAALNAVRAELDKYPDLAGIKLIGPEDVLASDNTYGMWQYGSGATTAHKNFQFLQQIGADPASAAAEAFFCIHGYEAPVPSTLNAWNAWANGWNASTAPGIPSNVHGFTYYQKKSWMTESSGESPQWLYPANGFLSGGAWAIALEIHQALTAGRESAYVYWQMTDGIPIGVETLTDSNQRAASAKYMAAKHFFRYIRPNSVAVTTAVSGSSTLYASAYHHITNQSLTIVLINSSPDATTATIQMPAEPAGLTAFQTFTSSNTNYWQFSNAGITDAQASVTVPGYGVVTLYGSVNPLPSISLQPQSQMVVVGSNVTFTVAATGIIPLSYQWQKDGLPIPGVTTGPLFTIDSVQAGDAGNYTVVVGSPAGSTTSAPAVLQLLSKSLVTGFLQRQIYLGIPGSLVSDLTQNDRFPDGPDSTDSIGSIESTGLGDNYGVRLSGFITPPATGNYTFYIASDDQSELYLSTDDNVANKLRIASEPQWNNPRDWLGTARRNSANPENRSVPIALSSGHRYVVEVLQKQGAGGEHVAVTWQRPGQAAPANGSNPIGTQFISYEKLVPYVVEPPVLLTVTQTGGTITFTWSATAEQRYQVQYRTNLSQPNWTNLVSLTTTNATATASDKPNSDTQRFYRIIWLP
ncbi:MAG: immunoglobulin domain-containing protein [Limisphaerales bacterium]